MPLEGGEGLATFGIPEPRGAIIRRGDDSGAIRAECRGPDRILMPLEGGEGLAAFGIPEPRAAIIRAGPGAFESANRRSRSGMASVGTGSSGGASIGSRDSWILAVTGL